VTRLALAAALLAALAAGGGGDDSSGGSSNPRLTVSAAASLKAAMTDYGGSFDRATVRLSFAGSDELAAQIRQGAKPDVFASANTKLPDQLYKEGKVLKPKVFAGNRLVIAVPADGSKVHSLDDLAKPGVRIAAGAPAVPVGSYTREVLARLPTAKSKAIETNIRSNEPDVGGVVGKLTQGAVDAGFVYVTDVVAAGDKLKPVELPASLRPTVAYGVAVVRGTKQPAVARAFVDGLLDGKGADALQRAGFEPPPTV
jgi:molybdate transport system substrate-binding protein